MYEVTDVTQYTVDRVSDVRKSTLRLAVCSCMHPNLAAVYTPGLWRGGKIRTLCVLMGGKKTSENQEWEKTHVSRATDEKVLLGRY